MSDNLDLSSLSKEEQREAILKRLQSQNASASESDDEDDSNWPQPGEKVRYNMADVKDTMLFMNKDEVKKNAATHPGLLAMSSFLYDGKSPREIAETLKANGDKEMRKKFDKFGRVITEEKDGNSNSEAAGNSGKTPLRDDTAKAVGSQSKKEKKEAEIEQRRKASTNLKEAKRMAIEFYTDALIQDLDIKSADREFIATVLSNRAQAHLSLGNNGKAMEDSFDAIQLDPHKSIKPYFRGAKAATNLGKWEHVVAFSEGGLRVDPSSDSLKEMLSKASSIREKKLQEIAHREQVALAEKSARDTLDSAIVSKGINLSGSPSEVQGLPPGVSVYIDESTESIHWPVMFLYPESTLSDFIADFDDADAMDLHIEEMFPRNGAPHVPWDHEAKYFFGNLVVCYERINENPGSLRKGNDRWTFVDLSQSLRKIITASDIAIKGMPVFYVLPKGSQALETFMEEEG